MMAAINCDLLIVSLGEKYPFDHFIIPNAHACCIYGTSDVSALAISWKVQSLAIAVPLVACPKL